MPELRPFRGLRYVLADHAQAAALLCPPYDVISAAERQRLLAAHPHNAVRLELPERQPGDAEDEPYARAAGTLDEWITAGVLRRDDAPLVYVYEQRFTLPGGALQVARSFFCRLRIEPYGSAAGVRAHESTLSGPKEDRFRLLSATRTNLSPVLLLYDDEHRGAASAGLLEELARGPAAVEAVGPDGVGQRVWLADPARHPAAAELLALAARSPLTIADGHHRYETALRYSTVDRALGAAYVLALLYDGHSGGLALLPWHRLVSGVSDARAVLGAAAGLFEAEPVSGASQLLARVLDQPAASEPGTVGLWTAAGGAVLRVDRDRLAPLMAGKGSDELRWLDVSVLSATLPSMTGSTTAQLLADERLSYLSDADDAVSLVERDPTTICFLVRPTPIESVLAVASAGEFMPAKSTYFHPKAATGLIFSRLD